MFSMDQISSQAAAQASHLYTLGLDYGAKTLGAIIIAIAAISLSGWARRKIRTKLLGSHLDATIVKFASNSVRWLILTLAAISILGAFGVQVASFAAIIGAVGFAVGLGLQGALTNVAAGVMLLIFRPFKAGDQIKIGAITAVVDEIDLFATTLDTGDRKRVIIPNGVVFGATIENMTHHRARRVDIDISIDPTWDVEKSVLAIARAMDVISVPKDAKPHHVAVIAVTLLTTDLQIQIWSDSQSMAAVRERALIELRKVLNSLSAASLSAASLSVGEGPQLPLNVAQTGVGSVRPMN